MPRGGSLGVQPGAGVRAPRAWLPCLHSLVLRVRAGSLSPPNETPVLVFYGHVKNDRKTISFLPYSSAGQKCKMGLLGPKSRSQQVGFLLGVLGNLFPGLSRLERLPSLNGQSTLFLPPGVATCPAGTGTLPPPSYETTVLMSGLV